MGYVKTNGKNGRPRKGFDSHGNAVEPPVQPPGGNALSVASTRRSTHLDQLRHRLNAADRSWQATSFNMMSGSADPEMRARMAAQYADARQDLLEKIDAAESLAGWDLVERFAPEWRKPAPAQSEPVRIEDTLNRGQSLPRGRVGAPVVEADPGYMARYEARMAEQTEQAAYEARVKAGTEALALAALND